MGYLAGKRGLYGAWHSCPGPGCDRDVYVPYHVGKGRCELCGTAFVVPRVEGPPAEDVGRWEGEGGRPDE